MEEKANNYKLSRTFPALHILAATDPGGSEMLTLNLSRHDSAGHLNLHVIAGRGGALKNEFISAGVPFRIIPRRTFIDPLFIYKIYKYCRNNQIRIIHCHQLLECLNAFLASKLLSCRIFLTYHGYFYFSKNTVVRWIGLFIARRVTTNIFVSFVLKEHYNEKYGLKNVPSVVIHNGISIHGENKYDSSSLRKESGAGRDNIILGMTGNFSTARNHLLVCRSFKKLLEMHPERQKLKLIIIGKEDKHPSPLFSEAVRYCRESGISGQVCFAGQRIDAAKLVKNFDLFVYSTKRETFCLSVAEAMSAGVPVLVNDIPVMREITDDGRLATLYLTDNEEDLYLKMTDAVGRIDIMKMQAEEKKTIIWEKFSIIRHLDRLTELYGNN